MSLLQMLGFGPEPSTPSSTSKLAVEIRDRLGEMPPERAEFVAAFSGLLVRVARADEEISEAENAALRKIIAERVFLSPAEADTVAEIVTNHAAAVSGIEYAHLTRAMNDLATDEEKEQLLDCLYRLATTDSLVTMVEDDQIRAVANALLVPHSRFIAVRQRYADALEVVQAARRLRPQ